LTYELVDSLGNSVNMPDGTAIILTPAVDFSTLDIELPLISDETYENTVLEIYIKATHSGGACPSIEETSIDKF
jgi:hypothetical protein